MNCFRYALLVLFFVSQLPNSGEDTEGRTQRWNFEVGSKRSQNFRSRLGADGAQSVPSKA